MTIEEVKRNAPYGCTHYDIFNLYYKVDGNSVYMWLYDKWFWYTNIELLSKFGIKPLN